MAPTRQEVTPLPPIHLMAPHPDPSQLADAQQVTRSLVELLQKWLVVCLGLLTVGLIALMISGMMTYRLAAPDQVKRPE